MPYGPVCAHCHAPLCEGRTYRDFFFCEFAYCSPDCQEAAHTERLYILRSEEYEIEPHTDCFWKVVDGNGEIVCITLDKTGAEAVLRRLARRKPPPFRPVTGASAACPKTNPHIPMVEGIPARVSRSPKWRKQVF